MAAPAALPFSFSQVPGSPSFRNAAVNTVTLVPLLSSDKDGEIATTKSAQSFRDLFEALRRHATSASDTPNEEDLLLVIPNSSLTRPGDWRYNDTPLKAFHWQHGCQRLHLFDGRPENSRLAHDRLMNHAVTRDWIDIAPSRRTAAVIGIINMHDCKDLADLHRAEEELHQWAERFATPPYEVTAHGRSFGRDKPVERLFVFDSFDEECQLIDLTKSNMGNSILAFPPADEAHAQMMDLHLNVVVNDLAVAIFRALETKIRESDDISKGSSNQSSQPAERRYLSRIISGSSERDGDEPVQSPSKLSLSNIAGLVSPDSKLAQESPNAKGGAKLANMAESASKAISSSAKATAAPPSKPTPQLLTPMDDIWDHSELSPRDADAFRKREIGRREKYAADLSLLSGSPLDAYERYLKAAELCKTGTPDPLWYAAAMEGCAAAHIAMAEAGGYSVDEYLETNFQMPEEIMALAKKDPKEEKGRQAATAIKQTFPEVVFALSVEAINILNRHAKLSHFHAELLLKLALYSSESSESHLRCRWGEGEGCYAGEPDQPPRWEQTSIHKLKFGDLKTKDGEDMIGFSTFNRVKKVCELLQQAVSVGALDPATRVDVAARSARMCLDGVKGTQWKKINIVRIELPRKAAFFAAVAAEAVSTARRDGTLHLSKDLWLLASQLYSGKANSPALAGSYGWTTLRASTLHALSLQGNSLLSHEAAELVLSLLGEASPPIPEEGAVPDKEGTNATTTQHTDPIASSQRGESGSLDASMKARREDAEELVQAAMSSNFATKLRDSFTTMTAATSILAVHSKWADDEAIKPVDVPLAEPSEISAAVLALGCVWSEVDYTSCSAAQTNCMKRIIALRRALPASSTESSTSLLNDSGVGTMPLYVSSAMAIHVDSTLELDFVKIRKSAEKEKEGAMATFYNPYENKSKSKEATATRVAEEEERAMLIQFGNRLAVPLKVQRCQLEFENNESGQVKATALAFVIPPKSSDFTVHFPFTVLSRLSADNDGAAGRGSEAFEVKGMTLTCLGRSFFLPIGTSSSELSAGSGSLPESASTYPYMSTKKTDEALQTSKPRIEASPCQPMLRVFHAASGAPLEAESVVTVNLSDGEIFTLPALRLENYSGPSGRGDIERLMISVNGLPGSSDRVLYDSDTGTAVGANESEDTFFHELIEKEHPPPLKLRALVDSLDLDDLSKSGDSAAAPTTVRIQVAGAHNVGEQLPKGSSLRVRFRYRGLSTDVNEVWRTREIILRIVPTVGPCITSMVFRPDLAKNSAYAELCKSVRFKPVNINDKEDDGKDATPSKSALDNFVVTERVGLDPGAFVCSNEAVFMLTVSNPTSSDISLSSPSGTVGGFKGNQLSTVQVHAGVSAKIPIVISRISRVNDDGSAVDIISELVAKANLVWATTRKEQGGEAVAKGHIRIPPNSLIDIVGSQPALVSQVCVAPLKIKLTVGGKPADESPTVLALGAPLDVMVQVEPAAWLSQEVSENCSLKIELCCTRKNQRTDTETASNTQTSPLRDFIWCGKQQQKMPMTDPNKVHSARIAFVNTGDYAVSACVRISRTNVEPRAEEIWFAPVAACITIDKSSPAQ